MRLKVSFDSKTSIISIQDGCKIDDLLDTFVEENIIQSKAGLKLKAGFPPKLINLTDPTILLLDVGIRSGDKLILEQTEFTKPKKQVGSVAAPLSSGPYGSSIYVPLIDGNLILRKIPDDNSCLFRSISYAVFNNLEEGSQLRTIVADTLRSEDSQTYNEAILGKPVQEYIEWIQKPTSWGGAIELQIISKNLNVSIYSLDVETGRLDTFGEDTYNNFIVVIYSGIHYDTVAFSPLDNVDDEQVDIGVFEKNSLLGDQILEGIKVLREKLNHKGYVTNTNNFKIKCKICNTILTGERHASEHASDKGHYEFSEV